jgi:hypothetical protein
LRRRRDAGRGVEAAGIAAALWRNDDGAAVTTRLPIVGTVLTLGEQESDGAADGAGPRGEDDD